MIQNGGRIFLHADDFGMNTSVTEGIVTGFTHGLLTSASILANAPGFAEAVHRWKWLDQERAAGRLASADNRRLLGDDAACPFDLGVHLNLTEGTPLTSGFPTECLDATGRFTGIGSMLRRLTMNAARLRTPVLQELSAQVERVIDAGLRPTHLNGHHYVELIPALAEPIKALAARFQIRAFRAAHEQHVWLALRSHPSPATNTCLALVKVGFARRLRRRFRNQLAFADAFCGTAHAGRMSLDVLQRSIRRLTPGATLEVALHPGHAPATPASRPITDHWQDPLEELRPSDLTMVRSSQLFDLLASADVRLGRIALMS